MMKLFREFISESIDQLDDFATLLSTEILSLVKESFPAKRLEREFNYPAPNRISLVISIDRSGFANFIDEPWEVGALDMIGFAIDAETSIAKDLPPLIHVQISIDPAQEPKIHSELYYELLDTVRHELAHASMKSSGESRKDGSYEYFLQKDEIPAMVAGLRLEAESRGIPLSKAFTDYLKQFVDSGFISNSEKQKIVLAWLEFSHADQ